MVKLCYNPISGIDVDKIMSDIAQYNPEQIVIFNELEWELRQLTMPFIQHLKDRNIDIKIIFGSFDDPYYTDYCNNLGLDRSNLIFWDTFWINWSEMCLKAEVDHTKYVVDTNFKYPFICLNNKNHIHRAALIDHLTKYNLLDKGIVTWHKFSNAHHGYQFKYYDDSIRLIDDDFNIKLDSFLLPKQWHESFLHVVGEANINVHFISEKTIIPLLLKKPFVCISKQGYNQRLVDLGFELYDELIDYSYDDNIDVTTRADILCKSISEIPDNYSELYAMLLPKIEHNYNRCLEIIHNRSLIPQIIIDRVNDMSLPNYVPMETDPRYETIVKRSR